MKDTIDYKTKIAIEYAADAKDCLTRLIDMLETKQFYPRAQQYIEDVTSLMFSLAIEFGHLQTLQNIHHLTYENKKSN